MYPVQWTQMLGRRRMEKISKYGHLQVEPEKIWGTNADIIPVVIGGLGAVTKNLTDRLTKIPGCPDQFICQKICLLGSTRILQDVLKRRQRANPKINQKH